MSNNNNSTKPRYNRVQIEWSKFLDPYEYVLLDKILFQSNLTHANAGKGYVFHVRTLAKDLKISLGKVSQSISKWTFLKKTGSTKKMEIQMQYDEFATWIVHMVNNDCSYGEPRSIKERSTCTLRHCSYGEQSIKDSVIEDKTIINSPERSEITAPQVPNTINLGANGAVKADECADALEGTKRIVHHMNNKKYVAISESAAQFKLKKGIQNIPSVVRQKNLVNSLNKQGYAFELNSTTKDGYKFCAYDDTAKIILITAEDKEFIDNSKTQGMCEYFEKTGYKILLWTSEEQSIFAIERQA